MKSTMPSGRTVFNPFAVQPQQAVASAVQGNDGEIATASAMDNMIADQCPKCGGKMGPARIATGASVFYCDACRVTHPIPQGGAC